MEIHILLAGIQLGPYSAKQVRDYLSEGLLSLGDKAREEGSDQWIEVGEMLEKFPLDEPAPAPDPNAVFLPEDLPPAADPRTPPGSELAAPPPVRLGDSKKIPSPSLIETLGKTTRPLGPVGPSGGLRLGKTPTSSVTTTAPLSQTSKKITRTALARALQKKTEPLPGRPVPQSPGSPSLGTQTVSPRSEPVDADAASASAAGVSEPTAPQPQEAKKRGGLSSMLRSLTAKTVPMRPPAGTPPAPAAAVAPPKAPPVPGGSSSMPITSPLPTRAIFNPAERRKKPAAPPPPSEEQATEHLPTSRKAAELRAKSAEGTPPPPAPAVPLVESEPELEQVDEPAVPKRRSYLLVVPFALLAVLTVAYLWLPYHEASALRDAMVTGNADDLNKMVEFQEVRDGLKEQVPILAAHAGLPSSPALTDAYATLTRSIDLYVTPTGVAGLIHKTGAPTPAEADQAVASDVASDLVNGFISQPIRSEGLHSATDFVLQTDVAQMHLKLQGLSWKLIRIDLNPNLPPLLTPVEQTYLIRGRAAVAHNEWANAIQQFTQVIALDPRSAVAYDERGSAQQAKGELDSAIKDFTQALTIDPQMAVALNGRGSAKSAKGDLDAAITDFTAAIKLDPTLASAYDSRGNAKTAKDDLDGAIADCTQAISIDPSLASAYSDRGFARQANGNLDGAITDYTQALALKPKTARAYFNRGLARQSQGNLEAAIVDYNRALAFDPKISDAYFNRGNAKNALHDVDGAIADFTEAIGLNSKLAPAFCNRGLAREAKADLDGALADYTQALVLDPKIAVAYSRRGLIEAQKGNFDGAIADSTQALYLDPKSAQTYYNRGFAKLAKNNLDGAISDLKTFCEAAPRDRYVNNAHLYLWLIAKLQSSRVDADQELSVALENSWVTASDDFTAKTAAYLLGRVTEADYVSAATSTDAKTDAGQHCQAWFFTGMKRLLMGDKATAADDFRKSIATDKKDFCEYILAQSQLQALQAPAPVTPALAPSLGPVPKVTGAP